ncbi:hypothetical protein F5890DRAFT_1544801 [Lentinula detonsa]|uniref:Uncharacterized protein n=1 Tax=Lentinula detonsa TaxID=2804962 RepID=A0AA38PR97_9AGAR|nr:hypothetical protein F5890DRAFT_1544801 [Lentinula detonsa]
MISRRLLYSYSLLIVLNVNGTAQQDRCLLSQSRPNLLNSIKTELVELVSIQLHSPKTLRNITGTVLTVATATTSSPKSDISSLLEDYADFADIFDEIESEVLPDHHPYNLQIDLKAPNHLLVAFTLFLPRN